MTIRLPVAARNATTDTISDLIDAGAGSGLVQVYSGAQPASADLAPTGTLLAVFSLNDPSFGAAASGTASLSVSPAISTTGVADGEAGWFRVVDSDSVTVFDGEITATGGGGDLTMSTTTVSVGLALQMTAGTITMPAS